MVLYSAEKKYFVEVVSLLDKQVAEMKLMTNAIRRLEGNYKFLFHILGQDEQFQCSEYLLKGFV